MLRELIDPANMVTAAGLLLSVVAIQIATLGHPEMAVALALWALLADHLDGVVAKRTSGRRPLTGQVGKSLDSLADLVSAGIFPGVLLVSISGGAPWAIVVAIVLAIASALRLSYFNSVGLEEGYFIGVPTTYALPLVAAVFLLRSLVSTQAFTALLAITLLGVAALHVSALRVPATRGAMYAVVASYCVLASALLLLRSMQV